MNLLERVLTLLRANLNSVAEKSDNPEKALRQLQLDMRNQLVQVKTEVAKAIAENHVLQKRGQAKKVEADTWLKKAEQAVHEQNDNSARQALAQYNALNKIYRRYQQQRKEQEQLIMTLRAALQRLEAKIDEAETTIELLETRKRNALIQQRVYEALQKTDSQKQDFTTQTMETSQTAEAQTLANLQPYNKNSTVKPLQSDHAIEKQLRSMKRQQNGASEPLNQQQENYRPHTGPLAPQTQIPTNNELTTTRRRLRPQSRNMQQPVEPSTDADLDLEYLKKLLDTRQPQDS
ncbi:PspA/IM30 family protein [Dictyobacter arantiisoli]|uniref:Phage shock protein A n=1 Tax=Dictyobacter arantiisoli TaxID=2014874 RepID=A0A5A5TDE7_9CHLR|nr:PspA/IM30 family protein [Dictyobacter arantiisoli]GCF08874.1 hypothetical protein KDI_24380 [Dictyobacter arantiisoli]